MRRLSGLAKGFAAGVFFFATVFLVNAAQILSLLLWPFSKSAYHKANRMIPDTWLSVAVWWAEKICGVSFVVSGDELMPDENAVIIGNHQSFADAVALFALAHRHGRLGDLSYFAKDSIKYWPGLGWGLRFVNCIFVKRNWNADRRRLHKTFSKITDGDLPFWFINFVEGTRMTPEKLTNAGEYAKKCSMRVPRHVLIPRTKGFTTTIEALKDQIGAVYDMNIGYEHSLPSLWQVMKGLVSRIHIHVRRFPIEELPLDENELSDWLKDRFVEKDLLLDEFYKEGRFSDRR